MKRGTLVSKTSLLKALAAVLWLICSPTMEAQDRDLEVAGKLQVPIPQELKGLLLTSPYAAILVEFDPEGKVLDMMPYEASHVGLVNRAMQAVEKATYLPAIVDGQPQKGRTKVYVNFFDIEQRAWRSGSGYAPQGGSVSDALDRRLYETSSDNYVFRESKVSELDRPLQVVESILRVYTSEEGVSHNGDCLVEYYVGPEGKIHFPRVIESDHDDLSMSALLTLEVTEFEPPQRRGNPTFVRVQHPFSFKPRDDSAAN